MQSEDQVGKKRREEGQRKLEEEARTKCQTERGRETRSCSQREERGEKRSGTGGTIGGQDVPLSGWG